LTNASTAPAAMRAVGARHGRARCGLSMRCSHPALRLRKLKIM
jgi:hypothetical protein